MRRDINAWAVIEQLIAKNGRTQTWLAKELNVSCAAITQAKQGVFALSGDMLSRICKVTHATAAERNALYTEVINARYFGGGTAKARVVVK